MNEKQYLEQIAALKKENEQNKKLLLQHSKMAMMGEMIGNIAHQWRQPLMELSSIFIYSEAKIRIKEELSHKEILLMIARSNNILKYMSTTIDDFRNFFSQNKAKTKFKVSEQIKRTVNILSNTLKNKKIKIDIILKHNPTIYAYQNEYSQVLINIISNAKDILIKREIKDKQIEVKIYEKNNKFITEITDNGGGIDEEHIDEIFKPFITIGKENGTGIGLFMSKYIIEKNMDGALTVSNTKDGAKFKITLPM